MEILLASELSKRDAAKKKYDAAVRMAATGQQGSSKRLGDKVTLLNGAAEVFEQSVEQMRSRLRDEVELSATDAFKKLSTESQYSGLVINDRYGLEIRDHLDRPVSVRSAGAEQIVALALIDGLNTAAGKRGPLVMDTPFGRLDVQHRARVLSYLPSMAEQVILLVHEGEMSHERDLPHIAGLVAAAYQINRVSPTQSSIEPK
jgi:DNA sulfur modification protein DndD